MRPIIKEPLLHFALLGMGLFALYRLVSGSAESPRDEIVVDATRVAALGAQFARTRQRPPTSSELDGLIDSYVRDEILYREGVALGLDRDDPVIRNRVRLKMELLSEESTREVPEAELQAWLDANPDRYARPARYDLRQIFFDPAERGDGIDVDIAAALRDLERIPEPDPSVLGDTTLLPPVLRAATAADIGAQLGETFAQALADAPGGRWFGPVASPYGRHIVRVDAREERRAATLADVRDDVERDVRGARAEAANRAEYERLRARYTVRTEKPDAACDEAFAAEPR